MELASIVLARTLAFVETGLLNPRGALNPQELVSILRDRFLFLGFPSKLEDFDRSQGITFKGGYFEDQYIEEMTIYGDGLKLDLRSSTEQGKHILTDTLEWLKETAGITFIPSMIVRWGYLSQLVVRSEIDLDAIHPAFRAISTSISTLVSERVGEPFNFRTFGLSFDFPKLSGDRQIASFQLERRAKTPDSHNLFYSQAPASTMEHLMILEEFERNLKGSNAG